MALSITQIITLRAPQFSTDTRLANFIELAESLTSLTAFEDNRNYAVALRVLHWMTKEELRGATTPATSTGAAVAGAIASETEGSLSRSFSSGSESLKYGDLGTTAYGCELIDLIKGMVMTPTTRRIAL